MRYVVTTNTMAKPVTVESDKPPVMGTGPFVELGGSYFRIDYLVSIVKVSK